MSTDSSKTAPVTLVELHQEYSEYADIFKHVAQGLTQQVETLLADNQISAAFPVQSRVKTWESIENKLARRSIAASSIFELGDLVGVRVVLQFYRDVQTVADYLRSNFVLVQEQDKGAELSISEFGYQSLHLTVRMPTYGQTSSIFSTRHPVAEIQIRTTAQHIWASASHLLQYKKSQDVPSPVLRSIYRVSAILEVVDLELERLMEDRQVYRSGLSPTDFDQKLNVDIIENLLDQRLPSQSKVESEDYASLLADLSFFGISTLGDLDRLLSKQLKEILILDEMDAKKLEEQGGEPFELVKERALRRALSTHTGLVRRSLRLEYPTRWSEFRRKQELPGIFATILAAKKIAN